MSWLITSFKEDKNSSKTWSYASALIIAGITSAFLNFAHHYYCAHMGMRIAVAMSSLIYRKTMRIETATNSSHSLGQMVNLLSNDVIRLDLVCHFIHFIWAAPIQLLSVLIITWYTVGKSTLAGAIILIIYTSFQSE